MSVIANLRKGPIRAEKPVSSHYPDREYSRHGEGTGETLEQKKIRISKIASELLYPNEVIEDIKKAKSVYEIDRIMTSARRGGYK